MSNHHPGNAWYRRLIRSNRPLYKACPKHTKLLVSKAIVQAVEQQGGRFLEKDESKAFWVRVSYKRAVEKTSQGLREREREVDSEDDTEDVLVPEDFSGKTNKAVNLADLASVAIAYARRGEPNARMPPKLATGTLPPYNNGHAAASANNPTYPPSKRLKPTQESAADVNKGAPYNNINNNHAATLPLALEARQSSMFRLLRQQHLLNSAAAQVALEQRTTHLLNSASAQAVLQRQADQLNIAAAQAISQRQTQLLKSAVAQAVSPRPTHLLNSAVAQTVSPRPKHLRKSARDQAVSPRQTQYPTKLKNLKQTSKSTVRIGYKVGSKLVPEDVNLLSKQSPQKVYTPPKSPPPPPRESVAPPPPQESVVPPPPPPPQESVVKPPPPQESVVKPPPPQESNVPPPLNRLTTQVSDWLTNFWPVSTKTKETADDEEQQKQVQQQASHETRSLTFNPSTDSLHDHLRLFPPPNMALEAPKITLVPPPPRGLTNKRKSRSYMPVLPYQQQFNVNDYATAAYTPGSAYATSTTTSRESTMPPGELEQSVSTTLLKLASTPSKLLLGITSFFDRSDTIDTVATTSTSGDVATHAAARRMSSSKASLLDDHDDSPMEARLRAVHFQNHS
jgi:hypothetical protein